MFIICKKEINKFVINIDFDFENKSEDSNKKIK